MYKINKLNAISDSIYDYLPMSQYEISSEFESYHGILVRSARCLDTMFPSELLAIARAGAGTSNIPVEKCTQKGICVFNTPGANANGVKEMVIASIFLSSRNLIEAINWTQTLKGQRDIEPLIEKGKKQFIGPEVIGKKLGIIGLGSVGALVANSANELGMEVYGYDPYLSVEAAWQLNKNINRAVKIDTIFTECDFISLHLPLNNKTKGMLASDQFEMMKKDVIILNFAKGSLVDNDSLLDAISKGIVKKYVVDFPQDELLGNDSIIPIPHLGASTPESEEKCASMAAKQLHEYIQYGNIENSVNLPDCNLPFSGNPRLSFIHGNKVNMVGQITTVLADHGYNIEDMINRSASNLAYTIIDTNKEATQAIIDKLGKIDGMIKVRSIIH